jgi:hypothetical protein
VVLELACLRAGGGRAVAGDVTLLPRNLRVIIGRSQIERSAYKYLLKMTFFRRTALCLPGGAEC